MQKHCHCPKKQMEPQMCSAVKQAGRYAWWGQGSPTQQRLITQQRRGRCLHRQMPYRRQNTSPWDVLCLLSARTTCPSWQGSVRLSKKSRSRQLLLSFSWSWSRQPHNCSVSKSLSPDILGYFQSRKVSVSITKEI
jgi:hypothetical protein